MSDAELLDGLEATLASKTMSAFANELAALKRLRTPKLCLVCLARNPFPSIGSGTIAGGTTDVSFKVDSLR